MNDAETLKKELQKTQDRLKNQSFKIEFDHSHKMTQKLIEVIELKKKFYDKKIVENLSLIISKKNL